MKWDEVKRKGSTHYKTEGVEPIDLYRDGGILRDFAVGSIIKYAFRHRRQIGAFSKNFQQDMDKIIHYANILKSMGMGMEMRMEIEKGMEMEMSNDIYTDTNQDVKDTGEE